MLVCIDQIVMDIRLDASLMIIGNEDNTRFIVQINYI